jgi:hypothetical protein
MEEADILTLGTPCKLETKGWVPDLLSPAGFYPSIRKNNNLIF